MRIRPFAAAFVALSSAVLCAGPAAAECVFAKVGEMAVDMSHGQPRVEIEANGQKRWVLLVTGSHSSALLKNDAVALGGKAVADSSLVRITPKGEQNLTYSTLHDVVIGGAFRIKDFEVLIEDSPDALSAGVAGYLGYDILTAADVEFDLANNRIAFFKPKGCEKSILGYWGGSISEAPMSNVAASSRTIGLAKIAFRPKVTLNGKSVTAELNSSYPYSVVDLTAAGVLGLKPGGPGVATVQTASPTPVYAAKFTDFAIGGEKINNPSFVLRDLYRGIAINQTGSILRARPDGLAEMILGVDFMRSHRILVANSQQKMYFSYNGGPVFRTPPAQP